MSFTEVREQLWIGGMPEDVDELRRFPRVALVAPLRAHEADVPRHFKPGAFCYMPFTDDIQAPSEAEKMRALATADFVSVSVRAGHDTIVLCREGRNRSGLVVAIAITQLTGCSGATAMRIVQARRQGALYNFFFQQILESIQEHDVHAFDIADKETP